MPVVAHYREIFTFTLFTVMRLWLLRLLQSGENCTAIVMFYGILNLGITDYIFFIFSESNNLPQSSMQEPNQRAQFLV